MKSRRNDWHKLAKIIIILGFLTAGAALYAGCGEDPLPPPPPPNRGTIIVNGEAV
jgi:hypothetical protein